MLVVNWSSPDPSEFITKTSMSPAFDWKVIFVPSPIITGKASTALLLVNWSSPDPSELIT